MRNDRWLLALSLALKAAAITVMVGGWWAWQSVVDAPPKPDAVHSVPRNNHGRTVYVSPQVDSAALWTFPLALACAGAAVLVERRRKERRL